MRVGNQDILLPVTMVGNYPEPRWFRGTGKYPGNPSRFVFDSMEQEALYDCISCIVDDQERAGFDIIADGRVFGGSDSYGQLLYHYMERSSGFVLNGPQIPVPIYSSLYAPTCVGEINRVYPYHVETLKAVRRATNKPIKISYTGVGAMTAATNNQHYKDIKELAAAYAKALNEDMKELADIGVDIIQLDEFVWPYGMGDWEIEALNATVKGVGRPDLGAHLLGQLRRHAGLRVLRGRRRARRGRHLRDRQAAQGRLDDPAAGRLDLPEGPRGRHRRAELRDRPRRARRPQAAG